jgi:hypothetical protein
MKSGSEIAMCDRMQMYNIKLQNTTVTQGIWLADRWAGVFAITFFWLFREVCS